VGQNRLLSGLGYVGIFSWPHLRAIHRGGDRPELARDCAGALSVGIVLVWQNIVSNFVIRDHLAACERRISEGRLDRGAAGKSAYVRDISVGRTRIETLDRTVPLLSQRRFGQRHSDDLPVAILWGGLS